MLCVICYWWGWKYDFEDVQKLISGVARNLQQPHRMLVLTDRAIPFPNIPSYEIPQVDRYLLKRQGCFARLRLFDTSFQNYIKADDRIVCMDLDSVVTGPLDPLFDRPEPLVILQGANASNPCPYNGSCWMLRAGYRPDVWNDFSLEEAERMPNSEIPDDQGWLAWKLPRAAGWKAGEHGLYAFGKPGWPKGEALPADARLVVFPGWRSPFKFRHLPWVREHWQ